MSEELQNYNFPRYASEPLVKRAPRLDQEGIDLVSQFLLYEAKRRLGAKEALQHAYFASLGSQVHTIADGERQKSSNYHLDLKPYAVGAGCKFGRK